MSDWSSDVWSSDLREGLDEGAQVVTRGAGFLADGAAVRVIEAQLRSEERRVGKECAVRVDLGGRRIITKKKVNQPRDRIETNTRTPTIWNNMMQASGLSQTRGSTTELQRQR